jgi:hypothetical protein
MTVSGSRPINSRCSRKDVTELHETIYSVVQENAPMTVRQVFYQLVSLGAIAKRERGYKAMRRLVPRLLHRPHRLESC